MIHDWFHSYLYDRTQYTCVNDVPSNRQNILCGVPQGSVLGPLLFLLYINDIPNCLESLGKMSLYADDTNIFIAAASLSELFDVSNNILQLIFNWTVANKLSINLQKTNYILFN